MKTNKLFGLALMTGMLVMSIGVTLSNACVPGYSPGYWKHQCKAYITERGHLQEQDIVDLAADTSAHTVQGALTIFTTGNNSDGHWTDLGNEFNDAAGYGPYVGN